MIQIYRNFLTSQSTVLEYIPQKFLRKACPGKSRRLNVHRQTYTSFTCDMCKRRASYAFILLQYIFVIYLKILQLLLSLRDLKGRSNILLPHSRLVLCGYDFFCALATETRKRTYTLLFIVHCLFNRLIPFNQYIYLNMNSAWLSFVVLYSRVV